MATLTKTHFFSYSYLFICFSYLYWFRLFSYLWFFLIYAFFNCKTYYFYNHKILTLKKFFKACIIMPCILLDVLPRLSWWWTKFKRNPHETLNSIQFHRNILKVYCVWIQLSWLPSSGASHKSLSSLSAVTDFSWSHTPFLYFLNLNGDL